MIKHVDSHEAVSYYDEEGRFHNADGPAVILKSGFTSYMIHGKFHREDGPAIMYVSGEIGYYLDGIEYTEDEHRMLTFFKTPGCAL